MDINGTIALTSCAVTSATNLTTFVDTKGTIGSFIWHKLFYHNLNKLLVA
jgi:hypothetical protein